MTRALRAGRGGGSAGSPTSTGSTSCTRRRPRPLVNPIAWQANYDGYQVFVFLHERGTFSALVVRSTDDR